MISTVHSPSELHAGGATVTLRRDSSACRLEVRTGDEPAAARSAALLVRQAVLDGAGSGVRSVTMTLDVSSPASGAVLGQLHDLAGTGVCTFRLRRAGQTVLVDVDISPPPTGTSLRAPSPTRRPTTDRPDEERQAVGIPMAFRGHRPAPTAASTARRAQRHLRAQLAGRSGVCGVGLARQGEGYALRVNVVDASVDVPAEVDGLPVDVCVTGPLTALPGHS